MRKSLFRTCVAAVAVAICANALPAFADNGTGDVFEQTVVPNANLGIKNAMDDAQRKRDAQRRQASANGTATVNNGTVAQAPPVSQQPIGQQIGLPTGIGYTADITSAYPFGNIGSYGKTWLMGGFDASVAYGINSTTRLVTSVFQLQHYPYGFNSGLAPVYLQGFQNPVGCADLSNGTACGPGTGRNINVRTKDTFGVFMLQKMVFPLEHAGLPIPLVISPTYVARGGNVGFSPNFSDVVPFTYNLPNGPVFNLATRTAQYYSVAFTLPFLKTPKMFGTFTVAPQWLVHLSGINYGNSMQLPQILYIEYTPTKTTKLWFEPQSARDYLPTDAYPEHLFAYFVGVSQAITKYSFAQVVLNSGNPTNMGPDGVLGIKCLTVQQALTNACGIAIGGLKATQIQFQIGVGSPNYFPL
jgi:hypothetical protein